MSHCAPTEAAVADFDPRPAACDAAALTAALARIAAADAEAAREIGVIEAGCGSVFLQFTPEDWLARHHRLTALRERRRDLAALADDLRRDGAALFDTAETGPQE